jgi:uncharacterized protein YlxW (UPF0749 family)
MWSLLSGDGQASRLRAAAAFRSLISRHQAVTEHELLLFGIDRHFAAMKRISLSLLLAADLLAISASVAQTPNANQEAKLLALIKEVQTQQAQLAENQAKIEEKLSAVSEIIRTARVYTKREK